MAAQIALAYRPLFIVQAKGNPTPLPATRAIPETIATKRNLYCSRYNDCLDIAVDNKWKGFSCVKCGSYERMTLYDVRADIEGFAGLLRAVHDKTGARRRPI